MTKVKEMLPFVLLFIFIFIIHYKMNLRISDDAVICNSLKEKTLLDYMKLIYFERNGRIFTDSFAAIFTYINPIFFKVLSSSMYVVISYCIYYIFFNNNYMRWIICALVCYFPFYLLVSAGYVATSTNYVWTTAALFVVLTGVKKSFVKNNNSILYMVIFTICALYAGNQEQTCAIFLGIYLFVFFINFVRKIKNEFIVKYGLVLSILSILFIMTSPGHRNRGSYSVFVIPDFIKLNFVDKIYLGITTTIAHFLDVKRNLFILFCIILIICLYEKEKKKVYNIISFVPLGLMCILLGSYNQNSLLSNIKEVCAYETEWSYAQKSFIQVNSLNFDSIYAYVPTIIAIIFISSIIMELYIIADTYEELGKYLLIMGMGFGSRVILGFSPTLFGSGSRTFIPFYFILIVLCVLFINKIKSKYRYLLYLFIFAGAGLTLCQSYIGIIR